MDRRYAGIFSLPVSRTLHEDRNFQVWETPRVKLSCLVHARIRPSWARVMRNGDRTLLSVVSIEGAPSFISIRHNGK